MTVPEDLNPTVPENVKVVTVTHDTVELSWDDSEKETSYLVMRRDDGAGSFSEIGSTSVNVTSYVDSPLSALTFYEYKIIADNAVG